MKTKITITPVTEREVTIVTTETFCRNLLKLIAPMSINKMVEISQGQLTTEDGWDISGFYDALNNVLKKSSY